MGSHSSNIANIQQSFMNNITQVNQQNCIATVTDTTNDNIVIVNGVNIAGNFTGVSSTASTDASCIMTSNMQSSISNILAATLQQTNNTETDMFGDFAWSSNTNKFSIDQSVTNNISQINESLCSANTVDSTNGNYVYVTNAKVGGDFIGVTSAADASANCSMTNNMKIVTYNQAQASASQSNTTEGMFGAMIAAFAGIVGIIVIGVIIIFAVGSIGYIGYSKTSGGSAGAGGVTSELQAAQSLGLTPDVLKQLSGSSSEGGGLESLLGGAAGAKGGSLASEASLLEAI